MQARIICSRASGIAKGGAGMVGLAGQYLNLVLEELCMVYSLQMLRVTRTFTVSSGTYGPFALPGDYLRTYDLFYQIPGIGGSSASSQTLFLNSVTMEQWDSEFKSPTVTNYPYEWAADLSSQQQVWSGGDIGLGTCEQAGSLYIYPASNGSLTLTHRYMKRPPDVGLQQLELVQNSPYEPWFPNSIYLINKTAAYMMGETGDDRAAQYHALCDKMLAPYLVSEGDEQRTVRQVHLDPRHFQFNRALKPTKAMPY